MNTSLSVVRDTTSMDGSDFISIDEAEELMKDEEQAQRQAEEIAQLRAAVVAKQSREPSKSTRNEEPLTEPEDEELMEDEKEAQRQAEEIAQLRAMLATKQLKEPSKSTTNQEPDESLERYKKSLLGEPAVPHDPSDPRRVLMHSMVVVSGERPPVTLAIEALTRESAQHTIVIKEGATYHIGLKFFVQHEPVLGMKFVYTLKKFKLSVASETEVVGSFAPATELKSFLLPAEVAPHGMLARGKYGTMFFTLISHAHKGT
jgi:hypothetical protein